MSVQLSSSCDVDCTTSVSVSDLWLQSQTVQTSWKSSLFVAVPTWNKKNMYWTYIVNSNMLHLMEGNGMKWNKRSNIHFPTDKEVLFFIFLFFHLLVTSFSVNTDSEGAGPSCTPACICSSCWCVKICLCLQYDSEVTSHLMVQLVACSTTNQSLICFKKKEVLLLHVHVQW